MTIKYETFYKYLPCNEYSLRPITEGTLKYTNCNDFNDPFDCSPVLYTDDSEECKSQLEERIRYLSNQMNLSPAQRITKKNELASKIKNFVNTPGYFQRLIANGFGVLSLSKTPSNILMWSHYADHHKGYLLKLRSPVSGSPEEAATHSDGGYHLITYPVQYSVTRPRIRYPLSDTELKAQYIAGVTSKAVDWQYEQESRVVDHIRGPGIHSYNIKSCLEGVVFGARIDTLWKNRILKAVEDAQAIHNISVTLEQARLSEADFKISINKL